MTIREVVNGQVYLLGAGCQWRALPKDLPPERAVNDSFKRWNHDGKLDRNQYQLYVNAGNKLSALPARQGVDTATGLRACLPGAIFSQDVQVRRCARNCVEHAAGA